MKKISGFYSILAISLVAALSITGCYTQLGSVRGEGEGTEEYQQPPEVGYYETPVDSNTRIINNYFFDSHLPSPYYRFSFSYYYPSYYWGWYYDPFFSDCYDPFFYNPWICGTPFITYGFPWYYRNWAYGYPYYGGGFYYHPRGLYAVGTTFHGTRNFGSTRGSTTGLRGTGPTREVGYLPPPAIPLPTSGTSTVTTPAGNRGSTPSAVSPGTGSGRTDRGTRSEPAVGRGSGGSVEKGQGQSGTRNTGSRRGEARPARRQSVFPPQYVPPANVPQQSGSENEGSGRTGGRESSNPPAPHSTPSYNPPSSGGSQGGGDRGGSSSGGGSGSRGGGGSSGGGSSGGGRSGGSTRGR